MSSGPFFVFCSRHFHSSPDGHNKYDNYGIIGIPSVPLLLNNNVRRDIFSFSIAKVPFAPLVSSVVSSFLAHGYRVASGGALGADSYVLQALLQPDGACPERALASRGVVFSAWSSAAGFPSSVRPLVSRFLASGGEVVWGSAAPSAPYQQAVARGLRVVVFLCGGGASLPASAAKITLRRQRGEFWVT